MREKELRNEVEKARKLREKVREQINQLIKEKHLSEYIKGYIGCLLDFKIIDIPFYWEMIDKVSSEN